MSDKNVKRYLFASDFDQTLTFNDTGYVLSELVGIPTAEFERKATGMASSTWSSKARSYPTFCCTTRNSVRACAASTSSKSASASASKKILSCCISMLENGIEGYHFDFYVLSAAPVGKLSLCPGRDGADEPHLGTELNTRLRARLTPLPCHCRLRQVDASNQLSPTCRSVRGTWCMSGTAARICTLCSR